MDSEMVASGKQEINGSDCKVKWIQVLQVSFAMHNFPPACDGKYLVIPHQHRGALGLWNLENLSQEPLILYGHAWTITALSLSCGTIPKLLCSCAEDWVILWNFGSSSQEPDCKLSELLPKSQAQIPSPGEVHFACFVYNDRILVLVVDKEIYLYKNIAHIATFDGHLAKVTAVSGCTHQPEILISVSEDRTFMIWDTFKLSALHKSTILTGSPIINVACDILSPRFVMGSMDGHIWMYDLSPGSQYRELASVDVAKSVCSYLSSSNTSAADESEYSEIDSMNFIFGKNRQSDKALMTETNTKQDLSDCQVEPGWAILGFYFQKPISCTNNKEELEFIEPWDKGSNFKAIMSPPPTLLIGMTTAIISLNLRTLEIDLIANLQNANDTEGNNDIVGLAGTITFSPYGSQENKTWCVVKSLFTSALYIGIVNTEVTLKHQSASTFTPLESKMAKLSLNQKKCSDSLESNVCQGKLSLIACEPLNQGSPLRSTYSRQDKRVLAKKSSKELLSKLSRPKSKESKLNSSHSHSRKSQGHSTWAPPSRCSRSASTTTTKTQPSFSKAKSASKLITKLTEGFSAYNDPPTRLAQTIRLMDQTASITSIDFSSNGKSLACATSLNSAHIIKGNGKVLNLAGHNATVNSVKYNLDGTCVLTASEDKTAKLWTWKTHSMVMDIQSVAKSQPVLKNVTDVSSIRDPLFSKEIKHAQFFYMDKFILLTCGNSLYLYKYNLEPSKSNLTKFRYRGRYKLVKEFPVSAQQILNTAAVNQFYSYLVLCACSDRSVRIFDMNVGSVVQQVFDVHTKPPYKICLNEGSAFATQHPSAYNMFLTTAVGDNIKLWDLRSNRCVQRYIGNMNRAFHCGLSFSPCARYFACGSEDKAAYVFDLRGGAYVHRLTGHSDVVTDVAYKPDEPVLVTATNDGIVSYFLA